jgi:glutathione peroxidase
MDKVIYDFVIKDIDGNIINLRLLEGFPILLINIASFCGYSNQLDYVSQLEKEYHSQGLRIILIPSNSFWQEYKSNSKIKKFCKINYNIKSTISEKTDVKGKSAHEIFKWIEERYNEKPSWNFYKYLFNKKGELNEKWASATKLSEPKILKSIEKILEN